MLLDRIEFRIKLTRLAAIPMIVNISVAILSTKIPILLGRDLWRFHFASGKPETVVAKIPGGGRLRAGGLRNALKQQVLLA